MDENLTLALADGRTLGYGEYGAPDGFPMVFFHGTPGSRYAGRILDPWSADAGVRLLAPERPGFGLSSPQQPRKIVNHAFDIGELCDALDIERFGVVGVSGGTPYVFACAASLAGRVAVGAVMSGFYGLWWEGAFESLPEAQQQQWTIMRGDPQAVRTMYEATEQSLHGDVKELWAQVMATAPERVREMALGDTSIAEAYVLHLVEGFRQSLDATVQEIGLETEDWGVDFARIACEIALWHGGRDGIPRAHVERAASLLERSSIRWEPDYGHVDLVFLLPELYPWLLDRANAFEKEISHQRSS